MRVLVFQADQREPLEEFPCQWLVQPFLREEDTFEIINCLDETPKLNLEEYDFFVITGSKFQAGEELPWIHYLLEQAKQIFELKKPILGICFGHQLLGRAIGAEVVQNPKGLEVGTVTVNLTDEGRRGRFFAGVPKKFRVFAYHYFEIKSVDGIEGAVVLAGNAHSRVQAFRYRDHVWGVQFHPEISLERAKKIINHRKTVSDDRSIDFDKVLKGLKAMPAGERAMKNFYKIAVQSWFAEQWERMLKLPKLTYGEVKRLMREFNALIKKMI